MDERRLAAGVVAADDLCFCLSLSFLLRMMVEERAGKGNIRYKPTFLYTLVDADADADAAAEEEDGDEDDVL